MDWKAKQAAKEAAASALAAANPHLVRATDRLTGAAKNARIELGRAFPGVKFSVKTKRFSGGDDMWVSWIDGPTTEQVEQIIDKYSGGDFDGMDDSYNYRHNAWIDAFGDAKYVFADRRYSDDAVAGAIRTLMARYPENFKSRGIESVSVADFRFGKLWNVEIIGGSTPYDGLQGLINRELGRRTWSLDKTPASVEMDTFEVAV